MHAHAHMHSRTPSHKLTHSHTQTHTHTYTHNKDNFKVELDATMKEVLLERIYF